jgi:hypothetical protein
MIQQGATTVFKTNLLNGVEDFTTGTYKIALYTALADLGPNTTTYASTSNELPNGSGYTAGGNTLVNVVPASSDGVAFISFLNTTWSPASFTARGALIYNSTTGAAVAVLDFGSDKTASNTFTVTFPTATATSAIIRLN